LKACRLFLWLCIAQCALKVDARTIDVIEDKLAIRVERSGGCLDCPSYVLGYLPDGGSYFRGIDKVRAMLPRGSSVRRLAFGFTNEQVRTILASTVDWLPSNHETLSGLMSGMASRRVFERYLPKSPGPLYCAELGKDSEPHVALDVRWAHVQASGKFCLGTRTPLELRQLVSVLEALYEYPDDMHPFPAFIDDPEVVARFARVWEDGGARASCRSDSADYALFLRRDGLLTISGRRGVAAGSKQFTTVVSDQFKRQVLNELSALRRESRDVMDASKIVQPTTVIAGMESEPIASISLHLKGFEGTGIASVYTLQHLVPKIARARIQALLDLGNDVSRLLPLPTGLADYCRSKSLPR